MSKNIHTRIKAAVFLAAVCACGFSTAHAESPVKPVCGLSLYTIEGRSMAPLILPGDKVETMPPHCLGRDIEDGDIIAFQNAAVKTAIIKRVIAKSGDRFVVKDSQIVVNGAPVTSAEGKIFTLSEARLSMIRLYEESYKGVVPETAYLVIGEMSGGTTDSTRFGMADIADIKGVMINNVSAKQRASVAPKAESVIK